MHLEIDSQGNFCFRKLSPVCAESLLQIPRLLRSKDPRVRSRLLPETFSDPEEEEQWRRFGADHLEHLFASRIELIEQDLRSLEDDGERSFRLPIRALHRAAWLSGLNAARLTLFIVNDLCAADMEKDPGLIGDYEKDVALLRIHLLAYMQELMLEGRSDSEG